MTNTAGQKTPSTSVRLMTTWGRLHKKPAGRWLFNRLLGHMIPYTGSIKAQVQHLEPGHAVVGMTDRRAVRNHLRSVHAIALANLAELSTGLAVLSGMPEKFDGILIGLQVNYEKKARGALIAECQCEIPNFTERQSVDIETIIKDANNDVVTTAKATWLIGPKP